MEEERKLSYMELWQQNQDLKKEIELLKSRVIEYGPVKGKGEITIEKISKDEWKVVERKRATRDGTEIKESVKIVPYKNVQVLYHFIKKHCPTIGDKTNYKTLAKDIVAHYKLPYDAEAFNGGNHRSTYFLLYQYPAKILHKCRYVEYSLGGDFTRLR